MCILPQGGYSTAEEMCLAFPIYYPATSMGLCGSKLTSLNSVFKDFAEEYAKRSIYIFLVLIL